MIASSGNGSFRVEGGVVCVSGGWALVLDGTFCGLSVLSVHSAVTLALGSLVDG